MLKWFNPGKATLRFEVELEEPLTPTALEDAAERRPAAPRLAPAGPGLNDPLLDEALSIVAPRVSDR